MRSPFLLKNRQWAASAILLLILTVTGGGLAAWKRASIKAANAAAASQPEPMESVTSAVARETQYRATATSIGTVLALNSITLRNELPGTVRRVALSPGQVVETGTVLVALDVSVEEADLEALQAQADLAQTTLTRLERLRDAQALERGWTEEQIKSRVAAQWPIAEKMAQANYVVWSEGAVDILANQLERIFIK